ncbi:MAG: hypothetical protein L3J35_06435 [Bacteroidales bacterium]|nr:hypothetical protein [Bacteroidales bacterium]
MNKTKLARIFMLIFGVIFLTAGIITFLAKIDMTNNFGFFLTGGLLVFLGLTWKKNKE